jgi:hypothetical protein
MSVVFEKRLGNRLRLGEPDLLGSHVNVIINVAVVGGKMSACHSQKKVSVLGPDLVRVTAWHKKSPFSLLYHKKRFSVN